MFDNQYFVYILSNSSRSTFYIGVTNNLYRRIEEHMNGYVDGFTKKYNVKSLVYYEIFNDIYNALTREKQLKRWTRNKKLLLIKSMNPNLEDLKNKIL